MPIERRYYGEVSDAWYLVPLLFGILGGLIAYVATKDQDDGKATNFLILGIFSSAFTFFVTFFYMQSLFSYY